MNPTGLDQATQQGYQATMNLTVYGPLGVLALLAIIVAIKLYLDHRKDRKEWQAAMDLQRKECETERKHYQEQMRQLEERYIAKADNALEKYHALAESLNRVLDSATRRYPRSSGGQSSGRTEDGT